MRAWAEILVPLFRDYFRSPRAIRARHRAAKSGAARGEARNRVNWSRTAAPLLASYRECRWHVIPMRDAIQYIQKKRERKEEISIPVIGSECVEKMQMNAQTKTRRVFSLQSNDRLYLFASIIKLNSQKSSRIYIV